MTKNHKPSNVFTIIAIYSIIITLTFPIHRKRILHVYKTIGG